MSFKHISSLSIAAACIFLSSPAFALTTGQCLPAAQARATLASENQNPIIVGNRSGYGYPTALIFTSNADGSKGYAIRGDKPFGEQAETVCVDSVYRDIRINDISKPGIPEWAKLGGNANTAEAICKRYKLGYQEDCAFHGSAIANLEGNGQHVMFVALGTAINPRDKSVRENQRLILTLMPAKQIGSLSAVTAEGANYMLSAYSKGSFTQHAAKLQQ